MARACTVCSHESRAEIDKRIAAGHAMRQIAAIYNVSSAAIERHRDNHLPAQVAQAIKSQERDYRIDVARDLKLLEQLELGLLSDARLSNDRDEIERWSKELRRTVSLAAKVQGIMSDATNVNIMLAPQFQATVQAVLAATTDPAARIALASRLMQEAAGL
jgi:hypothetical protein